MILLLLALACPSREIPPHLQIDRPAAQATVGRAQDLSDLIGADPLMRRPKPRGPGDWMGIKDGPAIEAWAAVARSPRPTPSDWTNLEQGHPGTLAVPLARGAKLAALEVVLAEQMDATQQQQVAAWLGATRIEVHPTTNKPRLPMDWLEGATPAEKREAALAMAERAVLIGWLASADIDVMRAAKALATPAHSRMLDTPTGALLLSRARQDRSPDSAALGRTALIGATTLALAIAAADRDAEQDRIKDRIKAASESLGGKPDPVAALLERARIALTADAGDPTSAALALTAITAERLHGTCPEGICGGLDRTKTLAQAAAWKTEATAVASAWRVVALKQAADTFSASHKKPSFGTTIMDIVDPLAGTGGGAVELSLLRYRTAEPTAILQISRLAGHPSTTDPEEALRAINARLLTACDAALKSGLPKATAREIRAIRDRARR